MSQGREREIEGITPLAYFPTELLSEERLDIRLVIDNQHPYGHETGPRTICRHVCAVGLMAMFPPGRPERDVSACQRVPILSPATASVQTFLAPARLTEWCWRSIS
jgi:hypothetical protein